MAAWGAIAGAVLGAGGTLWNALSGAAAERRRRSALAKRERENQSWYDRRYNEVGHERADAQRLLTKMREAQQARMQRAAGSSAVVGGSSASKAAEQQAANKAMGDTVAQIDAAQEARKDRIEQKYLSRKDAIADARAHLDLAHQQSMANAATQASGIAANLAASVGSGKESASQTQPTQQKAVQQVPATGTTSAQGTNSTRLRYSDNPYYGTTMHDNLLDYWRTVWNDNNV